MFDRNIDYSKTLNHAFVVDGYKLKNLTKLLQDQIGNVTFCVNFAHGVSYTFETVGDLIDYENPKSKEIRSIGLHAKSDDYSKSAMVLFHGALGSPAIAISLNVSQNVVPILLDEIQDVIRGMRPWYDIFSRFPHLYSIGIAVLFVLMGTYRLKGYISGIIRPFEDENTVHLVLRLIALCFIGLAWFAFYKMLVFVLPSVVFSIGQGKERFNRLKWFHGIIVTSIIGLIIGLIFFVI